METASLGQKVRTQREKEGWSQEKLANEIGISRNYLSQIERGVATNISWQVMQRISNVLGIKLEGGHENLGSNNLPPGLGDFAKKSGIPQGDIEMLAQIQLRGKRPSTLQEWELLYKAIKIALEE